MAWHQKRRPRATTGSGFGAWGDLRGRGAGDTDRARIVGIEQGQVGLIGDSSKISSARRLPRLQLFPMLPKRLLGVVERCRVAVRLDRGATCEIAD
jgi:hypothetical protein